MKRFLIILTLGVVFTSCLKDKTIEPVDEPVGPCADTTLFQDEIMGQIMDLSCNTSGCHDASTNSGGYTLENYSQISANSGVLLKVLQHDPTVVSMPLGGDKLADSLIQKFDCWIQQGMPNN